MEETKNVNNEDIVVEEQTEKVGFFKKVGTGIKKNAKKVAVGAAIGALGLITGYALGKKSNDEECCEDNEYFVDMTDDSDEVVE